MKNISFKSIAFIGHKGFPKEFPGTSGIEAYVEQQMLSLVKEGILVRSYGRKWTSKNKMKEYKCVQLITLPTINTKTLDTLTYSFLASIHVSFSGFACVWYHGLGPSFFAFIPKIFGKKVYTTIHSLDWNRKKWNLQGRLFLKISEKMTVLFADNNFVVSQALQKYFYDKYNKKFDICRYTVNQKKLPLYPSIIETKYKLKKNKYILYLGRLVPEKRIEWLIKASKMIKMQVVIAGGSSHTDNYVSYLKEIAKKSKVIFTDYVFDREKEELISNCNCLVLPSELEGFPISVVEALEYNRKCLVGNFLKDEFLKDERVFFFSDSYLDFYRKLETLVS